MDGSPEKSRGRKTAPRTAEGAGETAPPLAAAATTAEPAPPAEPLRECPGCGREVPRATRECPYCQFVVSRYVAEGVPEPRPEPEPELHPMPISEQSWNPPSEYPSLTPLVAVLALAILICVGSWIYARSLRASVDAQSGGRPAVAGNPALPTPAPNPPINQTPAISTPAAAAPVWHKVVKFKTGGTVGLASFSIRGNQWRVTWSTKAPSSGNGRFSIGLTTEASPTPVPIASAASSKQGTTTLTGAGDYTLNIDSPQPCLVMVEDYF